ncbi:arsenate reductase ArsC [Azomonas macrocytogenes]|uniref:Arsenate reductase n=1 Tax=Azomonas macrocytogenes TaxID=69962 RepID=A0A839T872_AZOMA|nr:arsenate reductase ArsC [Azomonas macrocytogenes]MBB3105060.1 arsenate reductase [Azomonas macrocytogenes]
MKVLFLCTANSCRSILCEAVFNHLAPPGRRAYSAGSQPKGEVHPQSLKALEKAGISTEGLYSKSSDAHTVLNPNFVISVCDKAAGEACPVFFGTAIKVTLKQIQTRIQAFLAFPFDQLSAEQLKTELALIGTL